MSNFFHMGGYAFYVWSVYGLAALVLLYNIIIPRRTEQKLLREIAHKQARPRRKAE